MRTTSEQKEKIKTLKTTIKEQTEKIQQLLNDLDLKVESTLSEEQQSLNKQTFKDNMAKLRAELTGYKEELKLTRLNKHGSSFFEFTPHKGFNRRQARQFRNQLAKTRKNDTNKRDTSESLPSN